MCAMPWNWGATAKQSVHVGGGVGTPSEAATPTSWPNYDAAYLAKRLGARDETERNAYANRYDPERKIDFPDSEARQVYLDKVAGDFHSEADECLKAEFVSWLEGTHEDNAKPAVYPNRDGQMQRRALFPTSESIEEGEDPVLVQAGGKLSDWTPTWWGTNQMTHLDGVREFLREKKIKAEEHEFTMNTLAEFGPNNIEQAWVYFKHWVKGRPVAPEVCVHGQIDSEFVKRSGPVSMATPRDQALDNLEESRTADAHYREARYDQWHEEHGYRMYQARMEAAADAAAAEEAADKMAHEAQEAARLASQEREEANMRLAQRTGEVVVTSLDLEAILQRVLLARPENTPMRSSTTEVMGGHTPTFITSQTPNSSTTAWIPPTEWGPMRSPLRDLIPTASDASSLPYGPEWGPMRSPLRDHLVSTPSPRATSTIAETPSPALTVSDTVMSAQSSAMSISPPVSQTPQRGVGNEVARVNSIAAAMAQGSILPRGRAKIAPSDSTIHSISSDSDRGYSSNRASTPVARFFASPPARGYRISPGGTYIPSERLKLGDAISPLEP